MEKIDLIQQVRKTPESWIYILIGINNIKYFPAVIQEKFKNQTATLAQAIAKSGASVDLIAQTLKSAIVEKYGMTPTEVLKELASGNDIFARDIAGICAVPELEVCDIDPETGFPIAALSGLGDVAADIEEWKRQMNELRTRPCTLNGYTSVGNNSTGQITAVYNTNTGKQVAARQPDGTFTNSVSKGKNSRNFWSQLCQVLGYLLPFIGFILELLGLGKKEYTNENTSALQSDGWWSPTSDSSNSSSGIMTLALAAGAIYLISSNNKKH